VHHSGPETECPAVPRSIDGNYSYALWLQIIFRGGERHYFLDRNGTSGVQEETEVL
jgi:hypothetical protein